MERVSDEQLDALIDFAKGDLEEKPRSALLHVRFLALTELRERRSKDAPCPEHAKMVAGLCKYCGKSHSFMADCAPDW